MRQAVIYKIQNKINGKAYIGSTINFETRTNDHKNLLRQNKHHSTKLQHAWNKYGVDNFEFVILEVVKYVNILIQREQSWMDILQSHKIGYNCSGIAGRVELTVQHKLKLFLANKGKKHTQYSILRRSLVHKGTKHTTETKLKMAAAHKLWWSQHHRKPTQETKLKMSVSAKKYVETTQRGNLVREIIVYTISTGRDLPMYLDIEKVLTSQIITNKEATLGECAKCKMFGKGGGCPPIAPTFDVSYRDKYQFGYIIVLTIPVDKWMPDKYREVSIGTRAFLMSNFVQIVMKPIETKMANILVPFAGTVFSAGYCGGCHKCNVKAGGHCVNPKERMFSMESTGILVGDTLTQIGMPPLDWFMYKEPHIPRYTCRVILSLTDKEVLPSNILEGFGTIKGVTLL